MIDGPPDGGWTLLHAGDPLLASRPDLGAAREVLTAYVAPSAGQAAVRDQMVAFLDAHPDALWRSCVEGHLTGSALVVDAAAEHVLMLFHTKLRRWLQPGGHVDGDANLAAGAWREATEETGIVDLAVAVPPIDLDIHEVRPPAEHPHLHLDVRYLVVAPADAVLRGNHESEALRWVGVADLGRLGVDEGTHRLAARGLATARALGLR